jgi:DNA-binding response OmpR family regulator
MEIAYEKKLNKLLKDNSTNSIFICEDEGIIAFDIDRQLQPEYKIIGKANSAEATLQYFEKFVPDLLICDIAIKGETDGIELGKIIHSEYGIPVIFLTGLSDPSTKARLSELDFGKVILKPFSPIELKNSVRECFKPSEEKKII